MSLLAQTTSVEEKADSLEMPRRAFGLSSSEQLFVQNAFQLFPKDTFAYIAIHGDNNTFQMLEETRWKPISHSSLAKWIAANRTYDGKTIVLLSCSDTLSTQKLTNALALLDQTATPKRPTRKIMGWNGEVSLYVNGFIQGDGFCKLYFPPLSSNTQPPIPMLLTGLEIPIGSGKRPTPEIPSLLMAGGRPLSAEGEYIKTVVSAAQLQDYLRKWRAFKTRFKENYDENPSIISKKMVAVQKKVNKQLVTTFVEEKTIASLDTLLKSWLHLKYKVDIGDSPLSGNYNFLVHFYKVKTKAYYTLNDSIQVGTNPVQYLKVQTALDTFVCVGKSKQIVLDTLASWAGDSSAQKVINLMLKAGKKTNLISFLGTTPLSNLDRNIKILSSLQNNNFATVLATFVKDTTKMPVLPVTMPSNHGLTVGFLNYIKRSLSSISAGNPTYVEDARRTISYKINKIIGDTVSYQQLLDLTADKSVIEQNPNRGSIFEHWGLKWFNKDTTQLGRTLFRKNPDNMYSDDEDTDNRIIMDFHYRVAATADIKVVAVELKHAKTVPAAQLKDRQESLKPQKDGTASIITRFAYIFAEKPITNPNFPNNLNQAQVVIDIRQALGTTTDIYYFDSIGNLKKI